MRRIALLALFLFPIFPAYAAGSYVPASADTAPTVNLNNGVISVEINGYYQTGSGLYSHFPAITALSVVGIPFVQHDNAGADFQMTARSNAGNGYNPTLEGDCHGNPSQLTGAIIKSTQGGAQFSGNWTPAYTTNSPIMGALIGVDPLIYQPDPLCSTGSQLSPYNMNFGVAIGGGAALPYQTMIVDMSIQKQSTASPDLVKRGSETPVAFTVGTQLRYAYYSTDAVNFQPATAYFPVNCAATATCTTATNDTWAWPVAENYFVETPADLTAIPSTPTPSANGTAMPAAVVVMLCNSDVPQVNTTTTTLGLCMAYYTQNATAIGFGRRQGGSVLTVMSMLGDVDVSKTITDTRVQTQSAY